MKNKKLKYILLPIVLLIWGGVIYMYFIYEPDEPAPKTNFTPQPLPVVAVSETPDTFSLILDYRDPFLGTAAAPKKSRKTESTMGNPVQGTGGGSRLRPSAKGKKPKKEADAEEEKVDWSRVQYMGKAGKSGSDEQFALLRVDGVLHTATVGQIFGGFEVMELGPGGAKLKKGEEEQWIGQ